MLDGSKKVTLQFRCSLLIVVDEYLEDKYLRYLSGGGQFDLSVPLCWKITLEH